MGDRDPNCQNRLAAALKQTRLVELTSRIMSLPAGQPTVIAGFPGWFARGAPLPQLRGKLPAEPPFGFWAPVPLPESPWHCLASSRLGQRHAADPLLLTAVEQVGTSLRGAAGVLLYARGLALASHLRAVSQRAGLTLLELRPLPARPTRSWFARQLAQAQHEASLRLYFFLLPIPGSSVERDGESEVEQSSRRASRRKGGVTASGVGLSAPADWLAIHLAATVHVLSVRSGGNIEAALRSRLGGAKGSAWEVRLLDSLALTEPRVAIALQQAGAARWVLQLPVRRPLPSSALARNAVPVVLPAAKIEEPTEVTMDFLFHWTRGPALSRRPESDGHCRQLLERAAREWAVGCNGSAPTRLQGAAGLPGPLRTLLEIVTAGRLIATGRWTINGWPVVSLTAQPLERWGELRTFRAHLGRWDFEPYGVGLHRDRVKSLGGRSVIYGDEEDRGKLTAAEAMWFQQARTRGGGRLIDWTVEQEWRVPGDIELRQFGVDEAVLFVPDRKAAEVVGPFSRWPVLIIPE